MFWFSFVLYLGLFVVTTVSPYYFLCVYKFLSFFLCGFGFTLLRSEFSCGLEFWIKSHWSGIVVKSGKHYNIFKALSKRGTKPRFSFTGFWLSCKCKTIFFASKAILSKMSDHSEKFKILFFFSFWFLGFSTSLAVTKMLPHLCSLAETVFLLLELCWHYRLSTHFLLASFYKLN